MKKDIFFDIYKRSDIIEDCKWFLNKMGELKPYLVEFNGDGARKDEIYPPDCIVGGEDCWPVIIITYDKYTFFANDGICKAWTRVGDTFLHFKYQRQGIIMSEFLVPLDCLNLFSLLEEKQQKVMEKPDWHLGKRLSCLSMEKKMKDTEMALNFINRWLLNLFL